MNRDDLITITFAWYKEAQFKLFRPMGSIKPIDRFAIDLGHFSIIIELWFIGKK